MVRLLRWRSYKRFDRMFASRLIAMGYLLAEWKCFEEIGKVFTNRHNHRP
jgi:hypothetical protein